MIVITTPTGNIGSKVLNRLLETTDESLRVIVRDRSKLPANLPQRVEIIEGSLHDAAMLDRAFTGTRALFWCQPDAATAPDYLKAYEDLAQIGCDAIRRAGVRQVVAISAAGQTPNCPAGPITALHRMESILQKSGASLRLLRCGSFFENMFWQWDRITEEGFFAHLLDGDAAGPQVATQDIAAVAAKPLADKIWIGSEVVQLLGPEDLSYNDMARLMSEHFGRPIRYEVMPHEAYRDLMISLGQSPNAAQGLVDMFTFLENGYQTDPTTSRSVTPTTFQQWLKTNA
jgi:uncharacterized protein YbjT (DUF2867 family)